MKNTGWQVPVSILQKTKRTQKAGAGEGPGEMANVGTGSKGPLLFGWKASVEAEVEKAQHRSSKQASLVSCLLSRGCYVDCPKHKAVGDVWLLTGGLRQYIGRSVKNKHL